MPALLRRVSVNLARREGLAACLLAASIQPFASPSRRTCVLLQHPRELAPSGCICLWQNASRVEPATTRG